MTKFVDLICSVWGGGGGGVKLGGKYPPAVQTFRSDIICRKNYCNANVMLINPLLIVNVLILCTVYVKMKLTLSFVLRMLYAL